MFNKDLGTIRLIVGNRGPRISVGTHVTFANIDKLIVKGYTATHGSYADGIWQIDLLDVGEYAEIYIEVDNQSSGQVVVNCEIHGDYFDPDPTNNTYTYCIGRTDNNGSVPDPGEGGGNDPDPDPGNGGGDGGGLGVMSIMSIVYPDQMDFRFDYYMQGGSVLGIEPFQEVVIPRASDGTITQEMTVVERVNTAATIYGNGGILFVLRYAPTVPQDHDPEIVITSSPPDVVLGWTDWVGGGRAWAAGFNIPSVYWDCGEVGKKHIGTASLNGYVKLAGGEQDHFNLTLSREVDVVTNTALCY